MWSSAVVVCALAVVAVVMMGALVWGALVGVPRVVGGAVLSRGEEAAVVGLAVLVVVGNVAGAWVLLSR